MACRRTEARDLREERLARLRRSANALGVKKALLGSSLVLLAAAGCGRAAGEPARFIGHTGSATVEAGAVREAPNRPPGFEPLGSVSARCRADEGAVSLHDAPLSDVDCSKGLLVAALREKAASVGGELLVGLACTESEQPRGELLRSVLHTCSAKVASRVVAEGPLRGVPLAAETVAPPRLPFATVAEAYEVSVTVVPVDVAAAPRAPRAADDVAELAVEPAGRLLVGDVLARCKSGCDRAAVRYAVRAGAGRVGATDVFGIACARKARGWLCLGHATRPEVDPELNAAAR